jgi:NADH-quinone oxidoreductase subunit A
MLLYDYLGLAVILAFALLVGFALPILSRLLGPFRPRGKKLMAYESGMDPMGSARERFSIKFYLVAMLFIVFDIEIVFMYPWAVQFKELAQQFGLFPLIEMTVFIVILLVGYIYLVKKGGLRWD